MTGISFDYCKINFGYGIVQLKNSLIFATAFR